MTQTFTPPTALPADWYGADLDSYVAQGNDVQTGDALLIATDQESLSPEAVDGPSAVNERVPVGSMLYALRLGKSGTVRCGYHKDYYQTIQPTQGLIWGKIAIRMQPCTPDQVMVGDLVARTMPPTFTQDTGPRVGIVVNKIGRSCTVWPYTPDGTTGRMTRSNDVALWDLHDTDLTKHLVRAVTWTDTHPLTEREDTTVSTDTPTATPEVDEKDTIITNLRRDLAVARRQHQEDIDTISEGFWDEAERRDWCSDAKDLIEQINSGLHRHLTIRERTFDAEVTVRGTTEVVVSDCGLSVSTEVSWKAEGTVQVEAYDADSAQERVEEDDSYVADNLSDLVFSIEEVEGADVEDEHSLIMHLESWVDSFQITHYDVHSVTEA